MLNPSVLIETYKKLFDSGKMDLDTFDIYLKQASITQEEYDYIIGKEVDE